MRTTLRVISALLRYPDELVQEAAGEFAAALAGEAVLSSDQIAELIPLIDRLDQTELLELQEDYVGLFDRGRAHSLHLFEHVHGESRDRGQAMVDLRDRYEAVGLEITAKELPDYLPLFLEYLSTLPEPQAREELAEPGVILAALAQRLAEQDAAYAAPLYVLCQLAGVDDAVMAATADVIAPADDPEDLEALDAAWEAEQVTFGAPQAPGDAPACPQASEMVAGFAIPGKAAEQEPASDRSR